MLAAGAAQGIGAATGGLTITDPASFAARAAARQPIRQRVPPRLGRLKN
jgi:hypothetical protein